MKATVDRNTLLKSLAHVHSVVERRNTIPILSNVMIEAGEFGLSRANCQMAARFSWRPRTGG